MQTPPGLPKHNLEEVNPPVEIQPNFYQKDITELQVPNSMCNLPHED